MLIHLFNRYLIRNTLLIFLPHYSSPSFALTRIKLSESGLPNLDNITN